MVVAYNGCSVLTIEITIHLCISNANLKTKKYNFLHIKTPKADNTVLCWLFSCIKNDVVENFCFLNSCAFFCTKPTPHFNSLKYVTLRSFIRHQQSAKRKSSGETGDFLLTMLVHSEHCNC